MQNHFLYTFFLICFISFSPARIFGLTADENRKPEYYFQINGGYALTGMQDAASSENIFLFIRRLVDLSPVQWNINGPAFSGSFHIEGNKFHHNMALEYAAASGGEYKNALSSLSRTGDSRWLLRARYRMDHYLGKDFLVSGLDFAFGPQVFFLWENTAPELGSADQVKFSGKYIAPSFLGTLRYNPGKKIDLKVRLSTGGIIGFEGISHPQSGTREDSFFVNGWRTALDISVLWYLSEKAGFQTGWRRFWRMEGGNFSSRFLTQDLWYFGIRCRIGGSK